MLLVKDNKR